MPKMFEGTVNEWLRRFLLMKGMKSLKPLFNSNFRVAADKKPIELDWTVILST